MKLLFLEWLTLSGQVVSALAPDEAPAESEDTVKINRFWIPEECTRQVHKGDFVRLLIIIYSR
jgi:hypothetical protein